VFALIGEVGTPTSQAVQPIATEQGVPFIGPFTGADFLREDLTSASVTSAILINHF
jgi:branched-chain amino acid transport system substrate-binding protein